MLEVDWGLLGEGPLALAVSGGADSFALLHACTERGLPVVALTVDHGLREGSAGDARVVAAWCAERGVAHETLVWEGEKPASGVQAAARTARYRLLCEACERLGLGRLASGHTLDDQAETVFMRLARGAGRGLAGMPPARKIASGPGEPVELLRPLLGARREATRASAEAAGLPVREDPSNEDEGFERVRVRALLAALEQQDLLTAAALGRTAAEQRASVHRETLDVAQAEWTWDYVRDVDGSVLIETWNLKEYGSATPAHQRVTELDGLPVWRGPILLQASRSIGDELPLRRVQGLGVGQSTNYGGLVAANSSEGLRLYREPAALLGRADGTPSLAPVPAPPGTKHLYDRRFVVTVPQDAPPGTELRPLGQLLPRDVATSTLARSRVCTLPCLSLGDRVTHLPAVAIRAVWDALDGWKGREACLPSQDKSFEARSLLAERFANEVIRY